MRKDTMKPFCRSYNLKNLINEPTFLKKMDNPSCIDLVITNKSRSFQKSSVIETGLSDFHRLTMTITNTTFKNKHLKY